MQNTRLDNLLETITSDDYPVKIPNSDIIQCDSKNRCLYRDEEGDVNQYRLRLAMPWDKRKDYYPPLWLTTKKRACRIGEEKIRNCKLIK